ncbi:SIS domain-containing protein [soil metagenome]
MTDRPPLTESGFPLPTGDVPRLPTGDVPRLPTGNDHIEALTAGLVSLRQGGDQLARWGRELAHRLSGGARLLAAGNGGSAAQAQHLTAELVGRYRDERRPLSALALHAETSSLTAIGNDYGFDQVFARQVAAHGRTGDVLLVLSTSGTSPNVTAAVDTGRRCGLRTWALTGPAPNPVASRCHEAVCLDAPSTATVQELHLVAVHLICAELDVALGASARQDGMLRQRPIQGVPA